MHKQVTLLDCFGHPHFRFIKGDALSAALVTRLVEESDVVIPLAAIVGAPACDMNPSYARLVNQEAIQLLLKCTTHQKILFPNTNSGYGIGEEGLYCDEETPLRPISLYGTLKVEMERELLGSGRAVSFRLATVFGVSPRIRLDLLVNDFTYRACHDKCIVLFEADFKRNYIHIQDVARAFLFGIENFDRMRGQAYNVGLSSANLSKRELCERIKRYVPEFYIHMAPIGKDVDQRNYIVSNAKLEALGWRATRSLDEGICELVSAYSLIKQNHFANA